MSDGIVVIWIDWYAYHNARFQALMRHPGLRGRVQGIELVGGTGVHAGLKFRETRNGDVPVYTLVPDGDWKQTGQRKLALLLWRKLNELNPATVFVPGYYTLPGLAAAIWGKLHRRCTVLMTESGEQDHSRVSWKERLKSFVIRALFDWAVAGGTPHIQYLERLGFPAERIARFYDVVDNDFFEERTAQIRTNSDPANSFLYVGRLSPEKNVDGLLRSFAAYRHGGGQWKLVLAGDGPDASSLRDLVQQLGVQGFVEFAGLQPASKLPEFYARSGCFVLPSTREPWGLVVNEAMASELPVIVSSRCGCAVDLVQNGINGIVFDPQRAGFLTAALHQISSLDPESRKTMGTASLERIRRYSPAQWADEVARIDASRATAKPNAALLSHGTVAG